jgi:hypothetical protein
MLLTRRKQVFRHHVSSMIAQTCSRDGLTPPTQLSLILAITSWIQPATSAKKQSSLPTMLYSVIVYLLALLLCPTALVAKPSSIHLHSTVINTGPDTTGSPEHHDHLVITNPSFSIAEAIARDDRVAARPYFEELQQVLDAPLPQQPAVQDLIDYGYLWPCTSKNSSLSPSEQSIRPAEPRTLFFLFDGMSLISPSLQTKPTDD